MPPNFASFVIFLVFNVEPPPQVSVENELDVLRQLVAACDTLLKQYPDTAVADQQLAQDAEKFAALSER